MAMTLPQISLASFSFAIGIALFVTMDICDGQNNGLYYHYKSCKSNYGFRNTFNEPLSTCLNECKVRKRCVAVMYSRPMTHCALLDNIDTTDSEDGGQPVCIYAEVTGWTSPSLQACDNHDCADNEKCVPSLDGVHHTCVPSECKTPPDIPFAHALSSRCEIGTRNIYVCKSGFTREGDGLFHCTTAATWTTPTISCKMSDWTLVFRGTPGNGVDVYNAWLSSSLASTSPYGPCTRLVTTTCSSHYRHRFVDEWTSLNLAKARYSLFKDGHMVAYVTFNATGSTNIDWFSEDRILASSWTDIHQGDFNYFSIEGDRTRNFFINRMYANCPNDVGYTVAVSANGHPCTFDHQPSYPQFLYADSTTAVKVETHDFVLADVMAIHVTQHET